MAASYGLAALAYNRHRAAIGSLFAFAVRKRWVHQDRNHILESIAIYYQQTSNSGH